MYRSSMLKKVWNRMDLSRSCLQVKRKKHVHVSDHIKMRKTQSLQKLKCPKHVCFTMFQPLVFTELLLKQPLEMDLPTPGGQTHTNQQVWSSLVGHFSPPYLPQHLGASGVGELECGWTGWSIPGKFTFWTPPNWRFGRWVSFYN